MPDTFSERALSILLVILFGRGPLQHLVTDGLLFRDAEWAGWDRWVKVT